MDYTEDDVRGLAAKIDGLALEPGEIAALSALLSAAEAEPNGVAGFAMDPAPPLGNRIAGILVVSVGPAAGPSPSGIFMDGYLNG